MKITFYLSALLFALCAVINSYAQNVVQHNDGAAKQQTGAPLQSGKALQLTNNETSKKKYLEVGQRVEYLLTSTAKKRYVGTLEGVTDSIVTIQGIAVPLSDIKSIGRRRKGSGFLAFLTAFMGTGLLINAAMPDDDPCPDCEDEGSSGDGTAIEVLGGVAFLALSINTVSRNSPADVIKKWKLEVIDASTLPVKKK